ncbi:hypothetical protein HK105_200934 [Polyrhizophydium stewartii]|uniref:Fungal lipase-type domain-containing protein n=1 Tax=Polyrhizophydium stewartii TaxID=2732419 RepID=A0ABR4NIK2_9FUNG
MTVDLQQSGLARKASGEALGDNQDAAGWATSGADKADEPGDDAPVLPTLAPRPRGAADHDDDDDDAHRFGPAVDRTGRPVRPEELDPVDIRGPSSARLHRFSVSLRVLQIFIILWLLSGLTLWLTAMFCVIINVAYVTFNSVIEIWSPLYGLGGIVSFIWLLARSFLRTYLRLIVLIWKLNAGAQAPGKEDVFFGTLYKTAGYIIRAKDSTISHVKESLASLFKFSKNPDATLPRTQHGAIAPEDDIHDGAANADYPDPKPAGAGYEEQKSPALDDIEDALARRSDSVGNLIYVMILAVIIGSPLIAISALYGYWIVISYLTMGISMAAACVIGLINLLRRFFRSYYVLSTLHKCPTSMKPREYLFASYIATLGMDDGLDLIRKIAGLGIAIGFWCVVSSIMFESFKQNIVFNAMGLLVLVVAAIIRTPFVLNYFRKPTNRTYMTTIDRRKYYNGRHQWPAWTMFGLRAIFFIVAFLSLVYYDGNFTAILGLFTSPTILKWALIAAFVIVTVLRDLLFLLPLPEEKYQIEGSVQMRAMMLGGATILQMAIAISACFTGGGYASSMSLVASFLSLDFRPVLLATPAMTLTMTPGRVDPRCSWTIYKNPYWVDDIERRAKRRGIMNTRNTLKTIGVILFAAVLIGFIAGGSKSLPFTGIVRPVGTNDTVRPSSFMPPVCTISIRNLDIQDFAAMALGAYSDNPMIEPAKWATSRPNIANFTYGVYGSLDTRNQSFYIEYRAPAPSTLSVVAVRGTSSFSDIFQDVYMYSTSVLLQTSSYAGTLVNAWPVEIVSLLVLMISSVGRPGLSLSYWTVVAKQVEKLQDQGREVIVTGHSLGGAVAGIVGANRDIPAVGFSAPGLGYQTANYGFTLARLSRNFINIVPNHDVVPTFDVQYGFIQDISCNEGEPLSCHSLTLTQTTLGKMCKLESAT